MRSKNILVITQWGYEEGLIQSYTLPYLKIIHQINPSITIYLVTQEKTGLLNNKQKLKAISEELEKDKIVLLPEKYLRAGPLKYFVALGSFLKHLGLIFSKNIAYVHSFCTPAGSYAYMLSLFSGKKLIIDSYEPHAEYMLECGVWNKKSFAFRILNALEKKQAIAATHLIATTKGMVAHTKKRFGIDIRHWYVKPACVDLEKFSYDEQRALQVRKEFGLENKIVCVYAGKFGDFYLKEEVFDFFKVAFEFWGDPFHVLLLSDMPASELEEYCHSFQLNKHAFTLVKAPHSRMPDFLSSADFGLSPYRPTPSKKYCTPIKNGEYWAVGLPVIITKDISVDSDIIEENDIGYVLKNLCKEEYLKAVKKMEEILQRDRIGLRNSIRKIAMETRSFSIATSIYKEIYQ